MNKYVRQAHGANKGATCARCSKSKNAQELQQHIHEGKVMYCKQKNIEGVECGGPVKPNITFFGEALPKEFFEAVERIEDPYLTGKEKEVLVDFTKGMKDQLDKMREELAETIPVTVAEIEQKKIDDQRKKEEKEKKEAEEAAEAKRLEEEEAKRPKKKKFQGGGCDLMIVIGTALAVMPFNSTVHKAKNGCPKILMNLENTDQEGFDFQDIENHPGRLFIKGYCDETVSKLIKDIGWAKEFIELDKPLMEKSGHFDDFIKKGQGNGKLPLPKNPAAARGARAPISPQSKKAVAAAPATKAAVGKRSASKNSRSGSRGKR